MNNLEKLALRIRRCQDNAGPLRCADDIQAILSIQAAIVDELQYIAASTHRAKEIASCLANGVQPD